MRRGVPLTKTSARCAGRACWPPPGSVLTGSYGKSLSTGSMHRTGAKGGGGEAGQGGHILVGGFLTFSPPLTAPPASAAPAAEGTGKEIAFLQLLSHIPTGLCSNSDFPNTPEQPEPGLL